MRRDVTSTLGFQTLLAPVDQAGVTVAGKIFDVLKARQAGMLFSVGAMTTTDSTHYLTCTLEESDTLEGDDFTTVDASDMLGTPPVVAAAAGKNTATLVGYIGEKRYIRPVFTFTGANASTVVAAYGVYGGAWENPPVVPDAISAT